VRYDGTSSKARGYQAFGVSLLNWSSKSSNKPQIGPGEVSKACYWA
jgi:hypothetical protein